MCAAPRIGYPIQVRTAPAHADADPRLTRRLLAAALVALTVAAYLPVVRNGFIWDDDAYVTQNETLRAADGLGRIWFELGAIPQYYPLVHTGFRLEHRLWGDAALGYHLVNVALHALCALGLWRVLALLRVPGAWWAAALFALHPVHVESVAWVTERKNVQSGAFYFASLLAYLHWERRRESGALYAASLLAFAAALLSKTVTASLPAVIAIVLWWRGRRLDASALRPLLPFALLGVLLGLATSIYERALVGAGGAGWAMGPIERSLVAGRALWFYLGKLVWPAPLVFNYPRWSIDATDPAQYVWPLAALAVAAAAWLAVRRIGRAPLAAALIFAGTLVPALGFFDVYPMRYSFVADHFQYLASAAPIALAVGSAFQWAGARSGPRGAVRWVQAGAGCLLAAFALLDWQRLPDYRDAETLWRATLRDNPGSWLAHASLCSLEVDRGDVERAAEHCEAMLSLEPGHHESHQMYAAYERARGRSDSALRHYARAIEIEPRYFHAQNGLGALLNELGRPSEAIPHFERALRQRPDYPEALSNLGNALVATGRVEEGIARQREALRLAPDAPALHNNLASALLRAGDLDGARAELERVQQLMPDSEAAARNLAALERVLRDRAAGAAP